MPGNDLTATRNLIPTASTRQDQARADITTILTNIVNDIEPKVTPAGLDISSALSFLSGGVYSPATNLGYLSFQNRSTSSGVAGSVYENGGELYYRDASGNNVQITSGGVLNAASLGGITGAGYGEFGRELNWDGTRYNFYDGAGTYGDVRMRNLEIEDGSGDTVTVDCPNLVSSYTFSLPPGAPSAAALLQADTSGNVTFSSTLAEDLTLTSGAEVKHGDRTMFIPVSAGWGQSSTLSPGEFPDTGTFGIQYWESDTISSDLAIPIILPAGKRIKSVRVYLEGSDSSNKTFYCSDHDALNDTYASLGSVTTNSSVNSYSTISSIDHVVVVGHAYQVTFKSPRAGDIVNGIEVTYDNP